MDFIGREGEEVSVPAIVAYFKANGDKADFDGLDPVTLCLSNDRFVPAAPALLQIVGNAANWQHCRLSTHLCNLPDAWVVACKLREAGFTAQLLKDAAFDVQQLKEADFTLQELKRAGFTGPELGSAGFTALQLRNAAFTAQQLKEVFTAQELKEAAFTVHQLKKSWLCRS